MATPEAQSEKSSSSGSALTPHHAKPKVKKYIVSQDHLATFLSSQTHNDVLSFIEAMNAATVGIPLREEVEDSDAIQSLRSILDEVEKIAHGTPPVENSKSRFGNPAFKSFYDKVKNVTPDLLSRIPSLPADQIPTLSVYFYESWGNRTRIDYGSGMELTFICFLLILFKLHIIEENDFRALSIHVFWRYMEVMRVLQSDYWLEPAGSHGVWGLDDYHFVPFILGSAQLKGHKYIRPKSIHDKEIVEEFSKDYMYLACIQFINSIKTASLQWHSPMLNDISAVKTWDKINSGLIKMYEGEVLSKLPVTQHFLFSPLLPFPGADDYVADDENYVSYDKTNSGGYDLDTGLPDGTGSNGRSHASHSHPIDDCCGIPVPSAFGAAKENNSGALRELMPGVPAIPKVPGSARRIPFD